MIRPVSARALLALGLGLALLLAPFAAGGLGTQTVYTYERQPLDFENDETVEHLYELPGVRYGTGEQLRVVREAADDGTVERREDAVSPAVRNLTRYLFVADDFEDRYYRVGARIEDGRFVLNAARADPASIVTAFGVAPADAPGPVRRALDESPVTAPQRVNSTLVETDGGAVLVARTGSEQRGDPLAVPKVASLALGVALLVGGVLSPRGGRE
jgi:hypothetical protein